MPDTTRPVLPGKRRREATNARPTTAKGSSARVAANRESRSSCQAERVARVSVHSGGGPVTVFDILSATKSTSRSNNISICSVTAQWVTSTRKWTRPRSCSNSRVACVGKCLGFHPNVPISEPRTQPACRCTKPSLRSASWARSEAPAWSTIPRATERNWMWRRGDMSSLRNTSQPGVWHRARPGQSRGIASLPQGVGERVCCRRRCPVIRTSPSWVADGSSEFAYCVTLGLFRRVSSSLRSNPTFLRALSGQSLLRGRCRRGEGHAVPVDGLQCSPEVAEVRESATVEGVLRGTGEAEDLSDRGHDERAVAGITECSPRRGR